MNNTSTIQEKKIVWVTSEELLTILCNLKGMPFTGVTLRTEVKLSKKAIAVLIPLLLDDPLREVRD